MEGGREGEGDCRSEGGRAISVRRDPQWRSRVFPAGHRFGNRAGKPERASERWGWERRTRSAGSARARARGAGKWRSPIRRREREKNEEDSCQIFPGAVTERAHGIWTSKFEIGRLNPVLWWAVVMKIASATGFICKQTDTQKKFANLLLLPSANANLHRQHH